MRKLDYAKLVDDIQNWIKEYVISANAKGVVLGLSGGIDSSVIAALSVNALGKENVFGLGLPCHSIPQDLVDAKLIVKTLGITNFKVLDLTLPFDELLKVFEAQIESNDMAMANLKPRLRMTTIYFVGQSKGYLVVGTGNRSEIAIGYFTKYGDGAVDFEPIGALYKGEVGEIAKILHIPESIIKKPPSSGLWHGQTDEGEIGITYNVLDEIIYRIDYDLDLGDLNKEYVKKIKNMIELAEHKNKIPPIFEII
jgi:NAD+ synthase